MLRLTGGELKGRTIQTTGGDKTRPTQAKLRQALFNSLQAYIPGARVLDLFAGSGALGFEAASRGADQVAFVESSRPALKVIEKNIQTLGLGAVAHLISDPVEKSLPELLKRAPFDLVMADPPYAGGWEQKLLIDLEWPWETLLSEEGHLCIEWGTQKSQIQELPERAGFLVKTREKNYGDSVLTTFRRSGS